MLKLQFCEPSSSDCKVLCLGSHSDDIEIGCGGTILQLLQKNRNVSFQWVVFSSGPGTGPVASTSLSRVQEGHNSANVFLADAKNKSIVIKDFRDGFFPYVGAEIKEVFEDLKEQFAPDIIFTHYRSDLHQDHRLISELTWNTFRNHLILEYEIPKYDGDLGAPNLFVELDDEICRMKLRHIFENFQSQLHKDWFTESTLLSLLRLRGVESRAFSKYAEAFYCRKLVLQT